MEEVWQFSRQALSPFFEPQNQEISEFYVVQKRRATDFEVPIFERADRAAVTERVNVATRTRIFFQSAHFVTLIFSPVCREEDANSLSSAAVAGWFIQGP